MKTNFNKEYFKLILNTLPIKVALILLIIFSGYGIINIALGKTYIEGAILIYSNIDYIVFSLLLLLLLIEIYLFKIYEDNNSYISRLKDKKEYIVRMMVSSIYVNTCFYVIGLMMSIIGLNLVCGGSFGVANDVYYNIPNIIYLIYQIIKIYLLIQIIGIINILLFKIINSGIVVLGNVIMYSIMLNNFVYDPFYNRDSLLDMPKFIFEYFCRYTYSDFFTEISCFLGFFLLMIVVTVILFKIAFGRMKRVGK